MPKRETVIESADAIKAESTVSSKKNQSSAYLVFSKTIRSQIIAENPGISFGDIRKQCGEMWRGMSKEQKMTYEEESASLRARQLAAKVCPMIPH